MNERVSRPHVQCNVRDVLVVVAWRAFELGACAGTGERGM